MSYSSLLLKISGDTSDLKHKLDKAHQDLGEFTGKIKELGTLIGVAFSAEKVLEFGNEVIKLAAGAEGVEAAFSRIPGSTQLLEQMRDATHGTVDELELMKRAVTAQNFHISLQALPQLLEFASVRAQQTGQSVDYLVDSIVTGIGRKSPLILDNLGISAAELKDKLHGASVQAASIGDVAEAVASIAEESFRKTGGYIDTTDTKLQQLHSDWETFKEDLGRKINDSGLTDWIIDTLRGALDVHSAFEVLKGQVDALNNNAFIKNNVFWETFKNAQSEAEHLGYYLIKINDNWVLINKNKSAGVKPGKDLEKSTRTIADIQQDITDQQKLQLTVSGQELADVNKRIERLKVELSIYQQKGLMKEPPAPGKMDVVLFPKLDKSTATQDQLKADFRDIQKYIDENINITVPVDFEVPAEKTNIDEVVDNIKKKWREMGDVASQVGTEIGASFGQMLSGQESVASGLANLATDMVQNYARIAIAGIISAAVADPSTGPFPFAKIAEIAIAAGIISSMFRALGAKSGGIGGSGTSGGGGAAPGVLPSEQHIRSNTFRLEGDFTLKGNDLVLAIQKTMYKKSRIG